MFEQFGVLHIGALLRGALLTVWICVLSTAVGCVIGLLLGLGMKSHRKGLRGVCKTYVNVLRGIPLLIILYFLYFAIPIMSGYHVTQAVASICGLGIYAGAYIGEIVYGAISSLPKGQFEASEALGMNKLQAYTHIIMPQAFRIMLPALVGFIIALIKDSSLVSVIGYVDLTRQGRIVSNLTMEPLLTFLCVGVVYFILCYSLSRFAAQIEKRMR